MKNYNLIFLVFIYLLFSCTNQNAEERNDAPEKEIVYDNNNLPETVIIADLPDSLQPKTVSLADAEKPYTFNIPKTGKRTYSIKTPQGDQQRITIAPPVTNLLPVLKNEKGETAKDKDGNPYILAEDGKLQFTNYNVEDGLPLESIGCSTIDTRGYLWFGTYGGVSCYDGNSFTSYTTAHGLLNNAVISIAADTKGNLWFGTSGGGVSRYDGKKFTNFTTEQGLAGNFVSAIVEDKTGKLWFSCRDRGGSGISSYDGKKFITYAVDFAIDFARAGNTRDLFEDQKGNILFLAGDIARFDGKSFRSVKLHPKLADYSFSSIIQDHLGHYWIGTSTGLLRFESLAGLTTGKYKVYKMAQGLAGNRVRTIAKDKTGNLWIATLNGGISKYEHAKDGSEGRFMTFTTGSNSFVTTISVDQAGSLWFGTTGEGVNRYDGKGITNFSTAHGLGNHGIRTIAEDKKGDLWFGTNGGGVIQYDGKGFTTYTVAQGLGNTIKSIFGDKAGNLWLGSQRSLKRIEPSKDGQLEKIIQFIIPGLGNWGFWKIMEDTKGSIWFVGQGEGVCRFDDKGYTFYSIDQGLASNDVRSMAQDHLGNMWFTTFGDGVSFFNGTSFTTFTRKQGLGNNFVMTITKDKLGNLWFGTQEGLSFLSKRKVEKIFASTTASSDHPDRKNNILHSPSISKDLFKNFTIADGLPDNAITQILELPNGKMAVGTVRGIGFFDKPSEKTDEFDALTGSEIFNLHTGYPVAFVNVGQNGMFLDSKGVLWAGTNSSKTGLVRFDFASMQKKEKPLNVSFKQISINQNDISWNNLAGTSAAFVEKDSLSFPPNITEEVTTFGRVLKESERQAMRNKYKGIQFDDITPFYPIPVNLVLPHRHNNITINYSANELAKPKIVQYQYILEGYDEEWSPVLNKTFATFGNMYEGTYTFKVKARYTGIAAPGADGWSEPVTYTFNVLPPWYRSWWAYTFYGLCFIAGFFVLDRFQRRRLIAKERERTKDKELEQAKEIEKAYTELKSTQSQLIQSEKMASLGELTAGIAHEIQNPLNFVNNFSEVSKELIGEMNEELDKGEIDEAKEIGQDIEQNLDKINLHGKRASNIVKGMLEHSRTNKGESVLTDINAMADEYLKLSFHGLRAKDKTFNADFKSELDTSIPKISLVAQDFGRVLLNLINNAFYAVNKKSTQKITGYKPEVIVSTKMFGEFVEISVKDNGEGIPEQVRDKIFQPFFTTKPTGQGTGLGLSLSYDIVKAHGGEISVKSNEGEGLSTEQTGTEIMIQLSIKKLL